MKSSVLLFLPFIAIGLFASPAFACSIHVPILTEYRSDRPADRVVFVGTVKSVDELPSTAGTTMRIRMEVSKWLSGDNKVALIDVRGSQTRTANVPCAGLFDFSAETGEQWLIFGHLQNGEVYPENTLSRRAPDGRVPAEVLNQLKVPDAAPPAQ